MGSHADKSICSNSATAMLEGMPLPSNMAAKTTFCLYLVKCLVVTFRCAINVAISSFTQFP